MPPSHLEAPTLVNSAVKQSVLGGLDMLGPNISFGRQIISAWGILISDLGPLGALHYCKRAVP